MGRVAQVDVPINKHPRARFRLCGIQANIYANFIVFRMAGVVDDDLFTDANL